MNLKISLLILLTICLPSFFAVGAEKPKIVKPQETYKNHSDSRVVYLVISVGPKEEFKNTTNDTLNVLTRDYFKEINRQFALDYQIKLFEQRIAAKRDSLLELDKRPEKEAEKELKENK